MSGLSERKLVIDGIAPPGYEEKFQEALKRKDELEEPLRPLDYD